MAVREVGEGPPARRPPRRRFIIIGLIIAVLLSANFIAYFYTDLLWFKEVGFQSVLYKSLGTQFAVGAAVGVVVAVFIWLNLWFASRVAPAYELRREPIDQYRHLMTPYLGWIRLAAAVVFGFFAGAIASSQWQTFLLWANRVDFGVKDPQFHKDIGFYVFSLPFFNAVVNQLWSKLFLALVIALAANYFYGSFRPQRGLRGVTPAALAHISVLLGLLALVKAGQYYLGAYGLNFSPRGVVTGASYTDVNAQLPALRLLTIISVVSAGLFLVNIRVRRVYLPAAAVGIWILTAVLAGGVWPAAVQRFSVEPQEFQREQPYIERNISSTNAAYGLTDVEVRTFPANADLSTDAVRANEGLLQNVRLWDPAVLQTAYSQLQAIRTYYTFPDVEVDRYDIAGERRQVMLAARELSVDELPEESKKWSNVHLQYTHGYNLVASLANESSSAGQPSFLVKDVPGTVATGAEALKADEPRIYYGEQFTDEQYSIVNSGQDELDYETEEGPQRSNYQGTGGIEVGGILRKIAFGIREADPNFVLSGLIKSDSRVLIYRNVRERVLRAAPFLKLDQDPYPVVIDGRITWVIDAYTTTPWYPYSQRFDAGDFVSTDKAGGLDGDINYVRNSVKVAIDAYNGTMTFYVVDDADPLIQAWVNAFPELFTDAPPPEELVAHFRYPEDLFKLQTEVFKTYHIADSQAFYSKTDQWAIAERVLIDSTGKVTTEGVLDPTYLLFQLPGETSQEFAITRPFTPFKRQNMIAIMVGRSDPGSYGKVETLQFPRTVQVPGPVQVDNLINQEPDISRDLSLLRTGGSRIIFGNLVNLPIEDSILYIQPLFVVAEGGGIPELKRVFMVLGEEVVAENTFEEALNTMFELDQVVQPEEPTTPEQPGKPTEPPANQSKLERLVAKAGRLYEQAQQALASGDFGLYGDLIEQLGRVLDQAAAAR
ncbi:MAG: uncharacterized protein QOK47_820 [Actinomycetota bacterium]|nr:uncharacterized protein [Actinomycetota bacterium]